jgi:hypothetical protein
MVAPYVRAQLAPTERVDAAIVMPVTNALALLDYLARQDRESDPVERIGALSPGATVVARDDGILFRVSDGSCTRVMHFAVFASHLRQNPFAVTLRSFEQELAKNGCGGRQTSRR